MRQEIGPLLSNRQWHSLFNGQILSGSIKTCFPSARGRALPKKTECVGDMPLPRKRQDWDCGPSFTLSSQEAVEMQLAALERNNSPGVDHGIEVLYRFADFDPFARCTYFGYPLDLGQFERFRRILHTPQYSPLLGHVKAETLATLQVSEDSWRQRVWVKGFRKGEEGVYEFAMQQRFGGRYDGIWFTRSLIHDPN